MNSGITTIPRQYVYRQVSEPSNPRVGDLWIDTSGNNNELNQYNGTNWELIIARGSDFPCFPVNGSLWRDTDVGKLKEGFVFDLSKVVYINQSLDVSGQDTGPVGIAFNNDGSKLFMVGDGNDNVYSYNLSTCFDLSTATFNQSLDVSGQDTFPRGICFNGDGSKLFMVGGGTGSVYSYDLSTAFDLSTATFNQSLDVSGQDTGPRGIAFNDDGSKLFMVGGDTDSVYSYDLSTAFDLSTATFNQSLDVSGQDTVPRGIAFNDDGSKLFMVGVGNDKVFSYEFWRSVGVLDHVNLTNVLSGQHHDQPRGQFVEKVQSPAAGSPVTVDLTALNDSICFSDLYLKARVDSTSSGYDKDVEVRVWYRGDAGYTVVASNSSANTTAAVGVTWNLKDLVNGVLNVPDGNKAIVKAQAEIVTGVDTTYHTVEIKGVTSGG